MAMKPGWHFIRIGHDLYEQVRDRAEKEDRSVNQMFIRLVKIALESK